MHPELKAYLDDYYARTMARYDAMDRQHDALLSKLLAGVPTPQSARPMSKAADGGLTDDATVPAVLPAAFSATTQAQEAPAVAHDAPLVCIEMAPVTCLMECPTQVVTNTSVDEVHDAATTVFLEPAVDLFRQEVEQLTPVPSISTNTTSTAEVVTTVATITDVDPKAGVLELDASPLPSINTSTPVASERDHSVILSVSGNLAAPAPTTCSAECPVLASDWMKPLFAMGILPPTYTSSSLVHPDHSKHLWHPSLIEQAEYSNHIVEKSTTRCLPPVHAAIGQEPWRPPLRLWVRNVEHPFRPRPWPSLNYNSVAVYNEETYLGTHHQSHEVSGFSVGLVPLPFSDVDSQVSFRKLISMEEIFSHLQVVVIWKYLPGTSTILPWPPTSPENLVKAVRKKISCSRTLITTSGCPSYLEFCSIEGSEGTQSERVNCQTLQSCAYYISQPLEIAYRWDTHSLFMEPQNTYQSSFSWVALVGHRTSDDEGRCPVMTVMFTSMSRNAKVQSTAKHLQHSVQLLPHDTYVMKQFSSALTSLRKALKYMQSVQLKPLWPLFSSTCRVVPGHWRFSEYYILEHAAVSSFPRPDKMLQTIQITKMSVQWQFLSLHGFHGSGHVELKKILVMCTTNSAKGLTEFEFLNEGTLSECLKCHIIRREIDSKLLLPSGVRCEQPTSYFEFASAEASLNLNESCTAALYLFEDYLSMWPDLPIVQFIELHVQEHATVCSGHRPDKIQGTMRIRRMTIQWLFLSLRELQGSGRFTGDCISIQCLHPCDPLACLMVQPICCCQLISMEEPFGYLQGAWRQSWHPPDRVTYTAEHAKSDSEAIHTEQVNFKGVHSYSDCMVHQLEGVARNNIDKGPTILVFGLHVMRFLSPDRFEPDGRFGVADCNAICRTTSSESPTRELPVLAFCTFMPSELLSYLDRRLSISWDHGALAMILSLDLAHRVVILVVCYLLHASYISLHRLPGIQLNQAHFQEGRSIRDYFLNHDLFHEHVQVHVNHCYGVDNYHGALGMIKDLQAPWDPGELFVIAAWGQAAFQEGRDVRGLSYVHLYVGSPADSYMGRARLHTNNCG